MKKIFLIIFFIISTNNVSASIKDDIIKKLKDVENISFNFEQNINGKIENGNCTIKYPKKIFCKYNLSNQKILVSNGKSLVIKTSSSYYRYPLDKTPLNLILDKNYLINKIFITNEKIIDQSYINYSIIKNQNKIDVFFDLESFDLIGWQTKDIYQNKAETLLYSISINKEIEKKLFNLPTQN